MRDSIIQHCLSDYATDQGKRWDDRGGQTEKAAGNKLKMYTHTHTHTHTHYFFPNAQNFPA